jgi:hypothetical protein
MAGAAEDSLIHTDKEKKKKRKESSMGGGECFAFERLFPNLKNWVRIVLGEGGT